MKRARRSGGGRRSVGLASAGVLVAIVGLVVWLRPSRPHPTGPPVDDEPASSADFAGKLATAYSVVVPPVSSAHDDGQRQRYLDKTYETYKNYLAFAVFPPWSRPADESQRNIVHWNEPIPKTWTFGGDEEQVYVDMDLDKVFAAKGETITATALAYHRKADGSKEPVPFDAAGEVRFYDEAAVPDPQQAPYVPGWVLAQEVPFADAAGGTKVATFVPSSMAALADGWHETQFVGWVVAGGQRLPMPVAFRYAEEAPFEVVGRGSDQMADGSLLVNVQVKVTHVAPVMVQAVLYDAAGETPIATYDDFFRPTVAGVQAMPLTFFGKVIHDASVDGPYSVRQLHGNIEVHPYQEVFWNYDTPIPTSKYRAHDFSGAEWQGPEKQAKMKQYEELISGIKGGQN